jgi:hypothetical protein
MRSLPQQRFEVGDAFVCFVKFVGYSLFHEAHRHFAAILAIFASAIHSTSPSSRRASPRRQLHGIATKSWFVLSPKYIPQGWAGSRPAQITQAPP